MIALTENGVVFDIDNVIAAGTKWAWFNTWNKSFITKNGEFSDEYTEAHILKKTFQSEYVITLDELPDWDTYTPGNTDPIPPVEEERIWGDANCDGKVLLNDAVLIMQSLGNPDVFGENGSDTSHITAEGMKNADVYDNGSGITNQDALQIQSYLLNMVETLEPDKK